MAARWREFTSWQCEGCGSESIIVEREDPHIEKAATFDRRCVICGRVAAGKTIRPAGVLYRITTPRDFYRGA